MMMIMMVMSMSSNMRQCCHFLVHVLKLCERLFITNMLPFSFTCQCNMNSWYFALVYINLLWTEIQIIWMMPHCKQKLFKEITVENFTNKCIHFEYVYTKVYLILSFYMLYPYILVFRSCKCTKYKHLWYMDSPKTSSGFMSESLHGIYKCMLKYLILSKYRQCLHLLH